MKKQLLKSMLVGVMTLAASSAWAGDKTVVKYSFDDAASPEVTAGSRVSLDYTKTSVITNTTFLNAWNNANGDPGASTISLGSTDLSAETWTLSFEWAAVGGCNSKADHTTLKAGDVNLFDISGNSNWNTTVTLSVGGTATETTLPVPGCNKSDRFTANTGNQLNTADYWHHFVITGSSEGVKLTITNSSTGAAIVTDAVLSETNVNPTGLVIEPCCGGAIGIDELSLSYYVEGEVVQTPMAAYTKVDGISRTIAATCDTEDATLYYSLDGTNWTEGAEVTVSESGNIYFKAVKGTSESDVLTFAAEAGVEIVLNAPAIVRNTNGTVTISADQSKLLLSPEATIYYTYGEETGSFTGTKELTVAADATITAYAEAEGYAKSADATRAVALFPEHVNTLFSAPAATKGWSANAFSDETITASERTYATLLLDEAAWSEAVLLQTDGSWGLRSSGNWYINSNTANSWLLIKDTKAGNIVVVDATFAPVETVNVVYAEKYSFGTKHAYIVAADGNAEFALIKPSASEMDYLYGVYGYSVMTPVEIAKIQLNEAIAQATALNAYANDAELASVITGAQATAENPSATLEDIAGVLTALQLSATNAAKTTLEKAKDLAGTFGLDTTAAQAVLDKEDATVQELATALKALYDAAVPAANKILSEAKSFFNTFDKTTAEALAEDFAAVETALAGTDINAIKAAAEALIAKATPAAKTALGKVVGYLEVMDNEAINADMAALKAAMEANDLNGMLAAAKQTKTDLTTAVPAFLNQVKATIDAGKADGKDVDALEAAYNAATAAIAQYLAAGDNGNVVAVGESIYNVIKAAQAYEEANRPDPAGYIVNAEFNPEADPIGWTPVRSQQFNDLGMGLIGTYQVRGEHPASTVDETHLATEFAAGLECRWSTSYAAYTQTTVEIPAGAYKLTFDVENTNASTTKANYENRFTVTVGETVYTDESTEWMQGKSAWTTHTIPFALTEASPITISLGFGTGSNNYGVNNTPALFVSHLKLEAISALDLALAELQKAIEAAEALVPTYPVGEGLFYYAAIEIEPLNQAIADAKAAFAAAKSVAAVKSATETLAAFVSTFAPAMTVPAENKLYAIANATATGNLCISTEKVTVATGAGVYFTAVEGGYVLSNEAGEYIFKTGNDWTLSTTTDIASAYVLTFIPVEGGYTIKGAKGLLGLDNTDEGSTVYANKAQANNGLWTIEEIAEDVALTKALEALNAEIAAAEALKTADRTNGLDEFNAAIDAAKAALTATTAEEVTAAVQALKTAELTFKKANIVIPEGKYYLVAMELADNNIMAAGMNWGTQGIVNAQGLDLNFIYNADADNYSIETNVYNGEANHFLGNNLFMDSPAFGWSIEEDAVYGHCIYAMFDGVKKYIGVAADGRLELTETPYAWGFFYAEGWEANVKAEGLEAMKSASMASAVDATFLLKDADFNRNDHRWEAWTVESGTITTLGGGCDETNGNGCAEAYHMSFTLSQVAAGAPAGTYGLTAQGFYRQDNDVEETAPYFFMNDATVEVPVRTGAENNMNEAGRSFDAGNYTADMILVYVSEGGELKVGITNGTNTNQWVIWDNFKLNYYGTEDVVETIITGINDLQANGQQNVEGAYTISGQKVQSLKKGLYIINGKKVVKK
ncbi:MAG: hypothetical protein II826_04000 [Prevotella sp.]|nr:hypothetical protein [Prevotella sp.]